MTYNYTINVNLPPGANGRNSINTTTGYPDDMDDDDDDAEEGDYGDEHCPNANVDELPYMWA